MKMLLSKDFLEIAQEIVEANKTEEEWAEIESDDMFQRDAFVGGFDADESEFCFSYYASDDEEWWFQVSLEQMQDIVEGAEVEVEMRPAE